MAALTVRAAGQANGRHRYQEQNSPLTLAQALDEYYRVNESTVSRPSTLPPESMALFRSHDICHVIFGLDTTLEDEAVADTRTLLSCDVGFSRYAQYLTSDRQAKAIFKQTGYFTVLLGTLRAMPRLVRALAEKFRMTKSWPWTPPQSYMSRTLADLRREYGIRVI